ncbi:hypothetical protein COCSUDRAFT_32114 [Coccomyxa subellipsoidea C-169]|uniref:Uncharacterized protein n=1 Tax=Coccomyxa subellipsoidea (strain C-169) TaxID=574566 RepID=I0ZAZ2_COCSC|nr:hypothetical protein COCSUDRAFT_32114 [Coccomyxa subellipsoidea C-169]EIE27811.1 hypothetical protein COCSUDRAFT_32114 [Coccomyxa subellipsoidea C-169]|eukprot:XP_005652355.1 hypothetical protein COCSUDRAFT_32114 [Coccomyxa subellipsoidea C-169]
MLAGCKPYIVREVRLTDIYSLVVILLAIIGHISCGSWGTRTIGGDFFVSMVLPIHAKAHAYDSFVA